MRPITFFLLVPSLSLLLPAGCTDPPQAKAPDATISDRAVVDVRVADGVVVDGVVADGVVADGLNDAPECGITGQACCPTGAPCLAPNAACSASNLCELDAACGAEGQDCCDGRCNTPDLVCSRSGGLRLRCELCGGPGQPCCEGGACSSGGCCVSDRCIEESVRCTSGDSDWGICTAGKCQGCGALDQPCCPGLEDRCHEGVCPAGIDPVCSACGETGQPCCDDNVCTAGCCGVDRLCLAPGALCGSGSCSDGSCGGCGGLGEPCCDPHATLWCAQSNTRCDGQFCVAAP